MSDELDEIWTLYADDGAQSLDTVEEALLRLKDAPADAETIALLFRAIHTFKGNTRVLGLGAIETFAHGTEDLIGLVRDEGVPLDGEMLALMLEAADTLRAMLEASAAGRRDVDSGFGGGLLARMTEKCGRCRRGGETVPGRGESAAAEPDPDDAAVPGAVIFDAAPSSLAGDPLYRDIFAGMVRDILREMGAALDGFAAGPAAARAVLRGEAERLHHAAEQIGMPGWPGLLAGFLARGELSAADAGALIQAMEAMAARDFALPAPPVPDGGEGGAEADGGALRRFFDGLAEPLAALAALSGQAAAGTAVDEDALVRVAEDIGMRAEALGFVRVVEAAMALPVPDPGSDLRERELRLHEELAAAEALLPEQAGGARVQPAAMLRAACADRVFESLMELGERLDRLKKHENAASECGRINQLMRHIHHACNHYGLETAAHLTMSLVDLFARVQAGEMAADPVLLHIARSFVGSMELLFDAVGSGGVPDMGGIETLFEAAANVTFSASGTVSSSAIEARLGLPKSFHKVLTPESVKSAVECLDAGQHFYIVRADLNQDEEVAGRFLDWINSGIATVISNVTVFQGDITLFDFLLATPMDEGHLTEAMAVLDPRGRALAVELALFDRRKAGDAARPHGGGTEEEAARPAGPETTISGGMLEAIGEAVAGQAIIHHTLSTLAAEDLVRAVEAEMRKAGGAWDAAQSAVRGVLEGFTARIEQALQAETQVGTQLSRLQEEAIAARTRPASLLLKPLEAFAETAARQNGRQVALSCTGDDTPLDHTMLESLKGPLRTLLGHCVTASIETPDARVAKGKDGRGHIRIALARREDHVTVTVEDDGAATGADLAAEPLAAVLAGLRSRGGDVKAVAPPTGGVRFHITMPMAMVVMDGMVVRVAAIRYVVPIDAIQRIVHSPAGDIMRVSADQGRFMLKQGEGDVVPVRFLDAGTGGGAGGGFVAHGDGGDGRRLFVVVGRLSQRVAVPVDELVGQQVVLVRPLQGYLAGIRGVTGCALLGGGEVGMVLDMEHVAGQAA